MNNHLLIDQIIDIQKQYRSLLQTVIPLLENDEYISVGLDAIDVFWHSKKAIIETYLRYYLSEQNAVFYTAATCFSIDEGDQYPFMLMGNLHIFDDPLGKYCEICHQGSFPKVLFDKVKECAKDNAVVLEKWMGLILILPLRIMWSRKNENDFMKSGEKTFLELFNGIPDMDSYFRECKSADDICNFFKKEYQDMIKLCESDNDPQKAFRERIEKSIEELRSQIGEGYSEGDYFFFLVYGSLQQALDIVLVSVEYSAVPMVPNTVVYNFILLLLPNFVDENDCLLQRIEVCNTLNLLFDRTKHIDEPLISFRERVEEFDFEHKALLCFDDMNVKNSIKELADLITQFEKLGRGPEENEDLQSFAD